MPAVLAPFLSLALGSCSIAFAFEYSIGQDEESGQGHQECNEEENFHYVNRISCGRGECTLAPQDGWKLWERHRFLKKS